MATAYVISTISQQLVQHALETCKHVSKPDSKPLPAPRCELIWMKEQLKTYKNEMVPKEEQEKEKDKDGEKDGENDQGNGVIPYTSIQKKDIVDIISIKHDIIKLNIRYTELFTECEEIRKTIQQVKDTKESYRAFFDMHDTLQMQYVTYKFTPEPCRIFCYQMQKSDPVIKTDIEVVYSSNYEDGNPDIANMDAFAVSQKALLEKTETEAREIMSTVIMLRKVVTGDVLFEGSTANICSICVKESIGYCIVPCGHSYCKSCCDKASVKCHTCRGPIEKKVKLFW